VINTDRPERFTYDNYVYMLKGLQISEGDWVPVRYAAIGWSAVLGFLYWVFSIDGIRQAETVSSITSGFFVGLTVPVVFLLLRDFLTNIRLICAMLLWITFCLAYFPPAGLTEPLYVFLGLGGTYLFIRAFKRSDNSLWLCLAGAGVLWGFASAVRVHGVVFLIAAAITLLIHHRVSRAGMAGVAVVSLAFWLAAASALIQRTITHGGPYSYYEASNIWVESGLEAWSLDGPPSTLREYVSTRSLSELAERFIVRGVFKQIQAFFAQGRFLPAVLLAGVLAHLSRPSTAHYTFFEPLTLYSCLVLIFAFGSLALVWPIFGNFRYWTPYLFFMTVPLFAAWQEWRYSPAVRPLDRPRVILSSISPRWAARIDSWGAPLIVAILLLGAMGWSYFGIYHTAAIELGNVGQTLGRIQHSGVQEDPDYLPGDGLELAKFLSRCCQHSKILNVGAGEGSHPFSILRHVDDVEFDRESGRPYLPRLDILVNFPGVFASVDDFLAYYQDKGRLHLHAG
jgi:hypothetical protein